MQRDPATVAQHLPADVLTDRGGSWETADERVFNKTCYIGLSVSAAITHSHLPSRCNSMLVLSRFLARATSLSVTLVQSDILLGDKDNQHLRSENLHNTLVSWSMYWPFHLGEVHHVPYGAGLTHHVETPQACVRVAGVERLEAVAQVPLASHLSQFTGQVLECEDTIQQERLQHWGSTLIWHIQILFCALCSPSLYL